MTIAWMLILVIGAASLGIGLYQIGNGNWEAAPAFLVLTVVLMLVGILTKPTRRNKHEQMDR